MLMIKSKLFSSFAAGIMVLLCSGIAHAQMRNMVSLRGSVVSALDLQPVAGAEVTLSPTRTGYGAQNYVVITDAKGYYEINEILSSVDTSGGARYTLHYTFTVSSNNFETYSLSPIAFAPGAIIQHNITLVLNQGTLEGLALNHSQQMLPEVKVTLRPTAYEYGSRDYTAITDASGRYRISGILRHVFTGSAYKLVTYRLYVAQTGYNDYVSEEINFQNASSLIKDVTVVSQYDAETIKTTLKDIKYRYRPLGAEPFFAREVGQYALVSQTYRDGVLVNSVQKAVNLRPGERIADGIFPSRPHEGSFIFYGSDRGLVQIFNRIISSAPAFDEDGKLVNMVIAGSGVPQVFGTIVPIALTRSDFEYDESGRLTGYSCVLSGPRLPFLTDNLKIQSILYDASGKIKTISYLPNPTDTWRLSGIVYNADGDPVSWVQEKL